MEQNDYKPEIVDLDDVLAMQNQYRSIWRQRFLELPEGKAMMLHYNNRQRAHQVRNVIRATARRINFQIRTRIIHAEPAIHGTDGWLLYWWKKVDTQPNDNN